MLPRNPPHISDDFEPILCFTGLAFANGDFVSEVRFASCTIGLTIISAD